MSYSLWHPHGFLLKCAMLATLPAKARLRSHTCGQLLGILPLVMPCHTNFRLEWMKGVRTALLCLILHPFLRAVSDYIWILWMLQLQHPKKNSKSPSSSMILWYFQYFSMALIATHGPWAHPRSTAAPWSSAAPKCSPWSAWNGSAAAPPSCRRRRRPWRADGPRALDRWVRWRCQDAKLGEVGSWELEMVWVKPLVLHNVQWSHKGILHHRNPCRSHAS